MTEGKGNSVSVKCSNTDTDPTDEASFPPAQPNDEQSPGETLKNQSLTKSLMVKLKRSPKIT